VWLRVSQEASILATNIGFLFAIESVVCVPIMRLWTLKNPANYSNDQFLVQFSLTETFSPPSRTQRAVIQLSRIEIPIFSFPLPCMPFPASFDSANQTLNGSWVSKNLERLFFLDSLELPDRLKFF
jgi:hypothetical protein